MFQLVKLFSLLVWMLCFSFILAAQNGYIISGKVIADGTGKPIQSATVHLKYK